MSYSTRASISPDPIFDHPDDHNLHPDQFTDPTTNRTSDSEHAGAGLSGGGLGAVAVSAGAEYDLKPPPPSVSHTNIEVLSDRLFSLDHLNLIIRDPTLHARFSHFLNQYKPHAAAALGRYIEAQKAAVAIEYANAVAAKLQPPLEAAVLGDEFADHTRNVIGELLCDALPAALTHQLVKLVCETLVKEITQTNAPVMREMIPSLAEVYCVTDPSIQDNPIVYASEGTDLMSERVYRAQMLTPPLQSFTGRLSMVKNMSLVRTAGSCRVPKHRCRR